MPSEKVWSRFEKKKKDGTVLKLRIQDLPPSCKEQAVDLLCKYYVTEEPCQKAAGVNGAPETRKMYTEYLEEYLPDPNFSCVICCSDKSDEVEDIMAVSLMSLVKEYTWDLDKEENKPKSNEWKTYYAVCADLLAQYNPIERHNLTSFYDDRALAVAPDYRGLGIARELLRTRRLICEAQNVTMTGAWMTSIGTQIAAARDGWETVSEVHFEDQAKRHGLVFHDVPPTMKYMIARVSNEDKQT